ncbi:hypothetical protein D3C87_775960 [compost metagenome]
MWHFNFSNPASKTANKPVGPAPIISISVLIIMLLFIIILNNAKKRINPCTFNDFYHLFLSETFLLFIFFNEEVISFVHRVETRRQYKSFLSHRVKTRRYNMNRSSGTFYYSLLFKEAVISFIFFTLSSKLPFKVFLYSFRFSTI